MIISDMRKGKASRKVFLFLCPVPKLNSKKRERTLFHLSVTNSHSPAAGREWILALPLHHRHKPSESLEVPVLGVLWVFPGLGNSDFLEATDNPEVRLRILLPGVEYHVAMWACKRKARPLSV